MKCKKCGGPTSDAPLPQWQGYCPLCVLELFFTDMTREEKKVLLDEALSRVGGIFVDPKRKEAVFVAKYNLN